MLSDAQFGMRAKAPDSVLARELDGETVLFELTRNEYYGLDATGSRVFAAVTAAASVDEAVALLLEEFDVDAIKLRHDVGAFLSELMDQGLVELVDA